MGNLEFDNLSIVYNNETDYSKRTIKRTKRIEVLCTVISVILFFAVTIIGILIDSFIIGILFSITVMALDIVIVMKLIKKISPPHYEFISWINQYKADEVEVGWFNDRYIALTYTSQHGWKARTIPQFLNTHKYNWEDTEKGFKYDKPIHMTIDLSKETAVISVKNKE